jgi:hypothetical protein
VEHPTDTGHHIPNRNPISTTVNESEKEQAHARHPPSKAALKEETCKFFLMFSGHMVSIATMVVSLPPPSPPIHRDMFQEPPVETDPTCTSMIKFNL